MYISLFIHLGIGQYCLLVVMFSSKGKRNNHIYNTILSGGVNLMKCLLFIFLTLMNIKIATQDFEIS